MEIFLYVNGTEAGPYGEEEVRGMMRAGALAPGDFAWREGLAEWQPVNQVVSLSAPPPIPTSVAERAAPVRVRKRASGPGPGVWVAVVAILLFVGLAGWGLEMSRKRSQQNAAQVQKLQQAQKDLVSGVRKALDDPKTAPAVIQKQVESYSQQVGGAASSMNGKDQRIVEAAQHFLQLVTAKMKEYNSAHDALVKGGFVKGDGINTKDDLQHRRQLVQALDDANNDVIGFYKNVMTIYRGELQKENVADDQDVEMALKNVEKQGTIQNALQVRELEADLLVQASKILDLYDREWGKWKLEGDGKILFDSTDAAATYNSAVAAIRGDAAKQKIIEQQVLQKTEAAIQSQSQ